MNLDIRTAVQTAFLLALLATLLSFLLGVRAIRSGARLKYFRKRNDLMASGWRMIFSSVILVGLAFALNRYAEPIAYQFFPPSATVTPTPTVTLTPTITQTPTITLTPTITETPSITNTPAMPREVAAEFESEITPNPDAIFSPLVIAPEVDENYQPVDPAIEFENPVGQLYGTFSYDGMIENSQWTALWYRGTDLVHKESKPWDGGTGGYGYTDWDPEASSWVPGSYTVMIFVGTEWKVSGFFTILGDPPTLTPTTGPTQPPVPTRTPRPTRTPPATNTPRATPTASATPTITRTPTVTRTPTATMTMVPSRTPLPTDTRQPTATWTTKGPP